jgi:peptidoglycan LD-endopeptidase CwlK
MPKFSPVSLDRLRTCDLRLQGLFERVVQVRDCTILEGYRDQAAQDAAFMAGKSKEQWPNGKHNSDPSHAVDVAPYPVDWTNSARFYYFAGLVQGIAAEMGLPIRYGGDWDGDGNPRNQSFNDLVHFEIVG